MYFCEADVAALKVAPSEALLTSDGVVFGFRGFLRVGRAGGGMNGLILGVRIEQSDELRIRLY